MAQAQSQAGGSSTRILAGEPGEQTNEQSSDRHSAPATAALPPRTRHRARVVRVQSAYVRACMHADEEQSIPFNSTGPRRRRAARRNWQLQFIRTRQDIQCIPSIYSSSIAPLQPTVTRRPGHRSTSDTSVYQKSRVSETESDSDRRALHRSKPQRSQRHCCRAAQCRATATTHPTLRPFHTLPRTWDERAAKIDRECPSARPP